MNVLDRIARVSAAAVILLLASGCAQRYLMIQTAQFPEPQLYEDALSWTREASGALDTYHDFEAARDFAYGGLGQMEGLYRLVPDDPDSLFLLNRAWAKLAYTFIDDAREEAIDRRDGRDLEHQTTRARQDLGRARFFGNKLVALRAVGGTLPQGNVVTLRAWLRERYDERAAAEELLWLGASIVGPAANGLGMADRSATAWVGVEVLRRSAELDDRVEDGLAHTILGLYYARAVPAALELAREHFERAIGIHGGRVLTTSVLLARTYHCAKGDRVRYFEALNAVLEAGDPLPRQRLVNTIAKRKARRYLDNSEWQRDCAFGG